jgi:protein arginine kinase
MLHLPAHTETGEIRALIMNLGKLGFAVRGLYGEGSTATGSLYQISNQLTLGLSEPDTIERLNEVVRSTIERERTLRRSISQKSPLSLEDRIWRAYGILSYARRITGEEAMNLLSDLRTGISMGYFKDISLTDLNHLLSNIQSNSICHAEGKPLTELERDTKRAALIQTLLKNETTDQDKDAENG